MSSMTIQTPWKDCYSLFISDEYVITHRILFQISFTGCLVYSTRCLFTTRHTKQSIIIQSRQKRCLSSITLYIYKFNYSNLFLPIFIQLTHWRRFFFFVSEYVIRNIFSVYVRTQNTTGLYSFISDQLKSLDGFSVISDLFLSCGCCLLDLSVVGGVIGSCLGILVAVTWPQSL